VNELDNKIYNISEKRFGSKSFAKKNEEKSSRYNSKQNLKILES